MTVLIKSTKLTLPQLCHGIQNSKRNFSFLTMTLKNNRSLKWKKCHIHSKIKQYPVKTKFELSQLPKARSGSHSEKIHSTLSQNHEAEKCLKSIFGSLPYTPLKQNVKMITTVTFCFWNNQLESFRLVSAVELNIQFRQHLLNLWPVGLISLRAKGAKTISDSNVLRGLLTLIMFFFFNGRPWQ